MAEFNAKLHKV